MADVNGRNFAVTQQEKERKIAPGELGGELQVLTDDVQLAANLNIGEKVFLPKLPEGALIHDAWVSSDTNLDVGARLDLGNSLVLADDGSTLHLADDNSLIDQADLTTLGRVKATGDEAHMIFPLKTLGEMPLELIVKGANITVNPKLGVTVLYSVP